MRERLKNLWRRYLCHPRPRRLFEDWRAVVRFLVVLSGLAWASHWLSERGVFRMTEAQMQAALDIAEREHPAQLVEEIVVVPIREEDLTERFKHRITAERLFPLIATLDALGARTVVVDIDTSDPGFGEGAVPKLKKARVVWAQGAEAKRWNEREGHWQYRAYPVLGGKEPDWSGVAVLEGSSNGIIDQYPRCVETVAAVLVPTLHWAAVTAYQEERRGALCMGTEEDSAPGHEEVTRINQLHNRYTFKQVPLAVVERASGEDAVVRDRLVVIGGMYSRADHHRTPFGLKWGWELEAAAMAATLEDLQHGGHTAAVWGLRPLIEFLLIELLLGLAILWMHHALRRWVAFWGTLGMLSLIVLNAAVLAAKWSGFRTALVPFLIGIWLHQLVESGE